MINTVSCRILQPDTKANKLNAKTDWIKAGKIDNHKSILPMMEVIKAGVQYLPAYSVNCRTAKPQ